MNPNMQERFERIFNFLGNGDPSTAKIWFVGIEEAEKLENRKDIDQYFDGKAEFKTNSEPNAKYTPDYDIMSKIVLGLNGKQWKNKKCSTEYRRNELFTEGNEVVQLNLYPLGKKSLATRPDSYLGLFGLELSEYKKEIGLRSKDRFQRIFEKRIQSGNPLTICFGKSHWGKFKECFQLKGEIIEKDWFVFHDSEKIIFTPFFRYGHKMFDNSKIEQLVNFIKEIRFYPVKK
jgi:hypothetical protein